MIPPISKRGVIMSQNDLVEHFRRLTPAQVPPIEPVAEGRLVRLVGMTLEAVGLSVSLGHQCQVLGFANQRVDAEVVGFSDDKIFLMPMSNVEGLRPGARVIPLGQHQGMRIGEELLGRVVNGLGEPLDSKGPLLGNEFLDFAPELINPMSRAPISQPLDVGIRSINSLITVGRGQRLGLFAGSGVGKSVLMGMMTKFTEADIVVVGLIGERGREVVEFIEQILGEAGLKRAVVVASPADDPPLMRLRASYLCTRVAEYYRDQGKSVLLLMDSLTRFAQAQREISLAVGEPPATKGYPPSVFAKIPQLVERAGNGCVGGGSITAFYTVLTEGDDLQDPVADAARAILDGHVVLSRRLAEEGVYPAVDIEGSISRAMVNIVSPEQLATMQKFKQLLSLYNQNKDLINIGAYQAGADPDTDMAIERQAAMRDFVRQGISEPVSLPESIDGLMQVLAPQQAADHAAATSTPS